jgi:3-oxoacyl-[acyl-carrier-protein] synthase II
VREGIIAPTMNLQTPGTRDEQGQINLFDVDLVPNSARNKGVRYVMNNTFGFGGHNCSIIIGRYE